MILNYFCLFLHNLLSNSKRNELATPHEYRKPIFALQNCQWRAETCFAGAAISVDEFLLQIPGRDRHN
jgi:hypothetical protein